MQENLLQFIWEHRYFNSHELFSFQGDSLEIISPGIRNFHQGPDFLQARIKIGDTEWVGNVELHVQTTDWHRHDHDRDPRYQNLILHVVWHHHREAPLQIPILELEGRVPASLLKTYAHWMSQPSSIPCAATLSEYQGGLPAAWRETLLDQRFTLRTDEWLNELNSLNGSWESLCWRKLARNFGYRVNADSFEELARSIPLRILSKHKSQIHQLEAMLLGQAGLLNGNWEDPYVVLLQKEYAYLRKLHGLKPIHGKIQFLRMRPGNFPGIRLAQLAMLVKKSHHLFTAIIEAASLEDLEAVFTVTANDFWHYHYRFGKTSVFCPKTVGMGMIRNIIINTVVPLLCAYGQWKGDAAFTRKAFGFLHEIRPEADQEISLFSQAGLKPEHAADTQAMHHMKRYYCDSRRCLECAIGNLILVDKGEGASAKLPAIQVNPDRH